MTRPPALAFSRKKSQGALERMLMAGWRNSTEYGGPVLGIADSFIHKDRVSERD